MRHAKAKGWATAALRTGRQQRAFPRGGAQRSIRDTARDTMSMPTLGGRSGSTLPVPTSSNSVRQKRLTQVSFARWAISRCCIVNGSRGVQCVRRRISVYVGRGVHCVSLYVKGAYAPFIALSYIITLLTRVAPHCVSTHPKDTARGIRRDYRDMSAS